MPSASGPLSSAPPKQSHRQARVKRLTRREKTRSIGLLAALARAVARQLTWALRRVTVDAARWRTRASLIPDTRRRSDALLALSHKRGSIEGASLFSILPARRNRQLLTLLVAYQILADYLDEVNEHASEVTFECGRSLQATLQEALEPAEQITSARWSHVLADGGYLDALVACCRVSYASLPCAAAAGPLVAKAAALTKVLCINHDPDPSRRERWLRDWAQAHAAAEPGLLWFESPAAASAWLTILALLALAADPEYDESVCNDVYHAYHPWISLLGTMLDSYSDLLEDLAREEHSYVAYYPSSESIAPRLGLLADRAMNCAAGLRDAPRHQVIVASLVAMYTATTDAHTPEFAAVRDELVNAGGWFLKTTALALRIWALLRPQPRRVGREQLRSNPRPDARGLWQNGT